MMHRTSFQTNRRNTNGKPRIKSHPISTARCLVPQSDGPNKIQTAIRRPTSSLLPPSLSLSPLSAKATTLVKPANFSSPSILDSTTSHLLPGRETSPLSISSPTHSLSLMSSSEKTSFPLLTVSLFLLLLLPFSRSLGLTRPGSSLDPRQLTALESLGFPATRDACAVPSPRDNATSCDAAAPFRHLISLRLANCSTDLDLPFTVLQSLSTLKSISFLNCPIPPPRRLPPQLASSLHSFSCISSLRRVPGSLLSPLRNLTELYLSGVPVMASAPIMIISQMVDLTSLTISNANLSGPIPHHWHCLDLVHLDFSFNQLKGIIPGTISMLGSLQTLNLSSNFFTGNIPDSIGDMVSLKNVSLSNNTFFGLIPGSLSDLIDLVQLDLSSNQFNGSIPTFFSGMKKLRVLNLENNNFQGVIPFNASFISKLEVFKVGGNSNLCYNHTILSSKLKLGIAPCNRYGLPMSPPGDHTRSDTADDMDDYGEADSGHDGGDRRGPNKLVLGVAIGLSCLVFLVIFLVCLSKVCA